MDSYTRAHTRTHAHTPAHILSHKIHTCSLTLLQELLRSQNTVRVKEEELHVKEVRRCIVMSSRRAFCMCARTRVRMCLRVDLIYVRTPFPLHDGE
jgi:hypothetical protein